MSVRIHPEWNEVLAPEFEQPYFTGLIDFVKQEYETTTIYPPGKQIFSAFDHCPLSRVRVVILGQDPYHGPHQANGLCFSVSDGIPFPPSLKNIFKEIEADLGIPMPLTGNLERWATQGVLLLNATLTVRANQPGSHQQKGWEQFTDRVVKVLSDQKEHLVFILWGRYAKEKGAVIDRSKHCVLEAAHPSPFSAYNGFFGCKHFSKANAYLREQGLEEVQW